MGRGRAKAKQTKVARELKYRSGGTDLGALRAELAGGNQPMRATPAPAPAADEDDKDGDESPEALYDGRYDVPDDEEDDDWVPARRQV